MDIWLGFGGFWDGFGRLRLDLMDFGCMFGWFLNGFVMVYGRFWMDVWWMSVDFGLVGRILIPPGDLFWVWIGFDGFWMEFWWIGMDLESVWMVLDGFWLDLGPHRPGCGCVSYFPRCILSAYLLGVGLLSPPLCPGCTCSSFIPSCVFLYIYQAHLPSSFTVSRMHVASCLSSYII